MNLHIYAITSPPGKWPSKNIVWGGGLLYYSVMVASKMSPPNILILKHDTMTYILVHILLRLKASTLVVQMFSRSFYQMKGQHHLAGVVSWGFGCALVSFVTPLFVKNCFYQKLVFPKANNFIFRWTIIFGENSKGLIWKRWTFSERGALAAEKIILCDFQCSTPQSCRYNFDQNFFSLSVLYCQEGLPGVYSSVSYHR